MACPKCGAPTNPGATFCPSCGASLNTPAQKPMSQPSPAPYRPPAKAKKSNKTLIIAGVIVLVVALIIAAVAAGGGGNKATSNDGSNDNNSGNSDNTASNSQLAMTVSDVQGYHSTNLIEQAADGNILIMAYANITNNGASPTIVSPLYFFMGGSDGKEYTNSWKLTSSAVTTINHGESTAIYCSFEIPVGVTPTWLKFDDKTDSINVTVTSSIVDLAYPQYVSITGASVAAVDSGNQYITPDAGNRFVQVTMTLKSSMPSTLSLYSSDFKLATSDGQTHDVTYSVDPVLPDGMQSGASATIKVTYEISQSATPTSLIYDDGVNSLTVSLG